MAVAEPPSKDTSAVALPGLARALVAAGKLGQKAAEDIYRKALTGKTNFISELTGSGAVSASDLAHTMSTAFAVPLVDLDASTATGYQEVCSTPRHARIFACSS
jgi:type IV pilus assembly protein PilB